MLRSLFLVLFLITAIPAMAADDALPSAPKWTVVNASSVISFRGRQMGTEFKGALQRYQSEVYFDIDRPERSRATFEFDLAGLSTGAKDRDLAAASKEWFDLASFPTATFVADSFTKTGEGAYTARGNLTIKGVSVPLTVPFTIDIDREDKTLLRAKVRGSVTLDRSSFGLGTGQWADTSVIANEVIVDFDLYTYTKR